MGFGWALFMPLVNTAVFSVIFTRVAKIDTGGMPYPLFAFCGFLTWNFFASSLRFATNSLTSNTVLVTKVFFPREIFPFSAVIVSLVDFAVGLPVLAALMLYYRTPITSAILFLPIVVLVHVLFTCAVSLVLSMANLFYRDVKYLFEVVITVWMCATSVLYPVELVGGKLGVLLALNPMTPIIDAYRSVLLRGEAPSMPGFSAAATCAVVTLAAAWIAFHRSEFTFAENV
jgi:ABC-type polysaccharide/polyol phosphate export permease